MSETLRPSTLGEILDRTAQLQSYAAKSFFLPVPDAKEIIARRVNFLKNKLDDESGAAKRYFSDKEDSRLKSMTLECWRTPWSVCL